MMCSIDCIANDNEDAIKLFTEGANLSENKKPDQAIEKYDQIIDKFGGSTKIKTIEIVAQALLNKSTLLRQKNKYDEAMFCLDSILKRLELSSEPISLEITAIALAKKGSLLEEQQKLDDAIIFYDKVIVKFGDITEEQQASLDKINIFDKQITEKRSTDKPIGQRWVASAFFNKALILSKQKKFNEAIFCYDEIIQRFSKYREAKMEEIVYEARNNKKVALKNKELELTKP